MNEKYLTRILFILSYFWPLKKEEIMARKWGMKESGMFGPKRSFIIRPKHYRFRIMVTSLHSLSFNGAWILAVGKRNSQDYGPIMTENNAGPATNGWTGGRPRFGRRPGLFYPLVAVRHWRDVSHFPSQVHMLGPQRPLELAPTV